MRVFRLSEAMGEPVAELRLRWPVDLILTVMSHGWAYLEPWRWYRENSVLAHAERIGNAVGWVALRQRDPRTLLVSWEGLTEAPGAEILKRAGRWVSADWDPGDAIAALRLAFPEEAELIARGGGRLLRGSTFYEDFVKTILTINTSWSSTCRMTAALVAEPGDGAFPLPLQLLEYGEERLRGIAKLGFRAPTVIATTRRMLDDGVIDAAGEGDPDHDYLTSLKGIGPYAAAHCRLLLHDFSRIPVDSLVTSYFRERYGHGPGEFAASRAESASHLALGYRLMRLRERLAGGPEG